VLFLYSYFIIELEINLLVKKINKLKKYWPRCSNVAIFNKLPKLCSLVFKAKDSDELEANIIGLGPNLFYKFNKKNMNNKLISQKICFLAIMLINQLPNCPITQLPNYPINQNKIPNLFFP
jgi:hypothetical protein